MKNRVSMFLMLLMAAGVSQAEQKIGYVNIGKVMEKSPQAAKARAKLEAEFGPRDKALTSQQKEIKTLEEKLGRDAEVMGDAERRKAEKDIIEKKRDLARSAQEFQEDANLRRNEEMGTVVKRIQDVIKGLGKEESYDMLLSSEAVLYHDDANDVTAKVQQRLETQP